MDLSERIQAHIVSIWREGKGMFSIGGKEGMLVLTDRHLMFVHKTDVRMNWWRTIRERQVVNFIRSRNTMIIHDGYTEKDLARDMEDERNEEIPLDDITRIYHEEKVWGSVLNLEYMGRDKARRYQYAVAQDWVKYPAKEPTKYMRVDWQPFVEYIRERQRPA